MAGAAGVTSMDTRVADVTVRVELPDTFPDAAVISAAPTARPLACPLLPAALLTAATAGSDEIQVTEPVRSWVLPSEKIPVALNCWLSPLGRLGSVGITSMAVRVADVTVSGALPVLPPKDAVMTAEPAATAEVNPLDSGALLTDATVVSELLQVAAAVSS